MQNKISEFFSKHQLGIFIAISAVTAIVLAVISVSIYVSSGAINVDCSLPTDAEVCKRVIVENEDEKSFPASGFFNEQAIKDFDAVYDDIESGLSQMGNFGTDVISDEALDLK